ncbi:MAG: hypothetical protein ACYCYM_14755, partial [Saccharofermentanales bacterium]
VDAKLGINLVDQVIANGGTRVITVEDFVIPQDASDPYINEVTVHATLADGFPNTYDDTARWETNLFQPAIDVVKTGDALSKIGDTVDYTITVSNNSSSDTPAMYFDIVDALIGVNEQDVAIANGASYIIHKNGFVIPEGAADPFVNTVSVHATVAGFPNTYDDTARWEINLFQPAIDVVKTGDALSKIGDTVDYTITVSNNSSSDTPAMAFDIVDAMLGVNEQDVVIANGASYIIHKNGFVIPEGAADPFVNTVSVHATVAGFPNTYDDTARWSTNLFQPAIDVVKTGSTLSKIGDPVNYTITVSNNSSIDTPEMYFDIVDALIGVNEQDVVIANGASYIIHKNGFVIPESAADPFVNTVSVHATLAGFPNTYDDTARWETNLFQPGITLTKWGNKTEAAPGEWIHYIITVTNTSSSDTPNLVGGVTDTLGGYLGAVNMAPGAVVVFAYDYQMPNLPVNSILRNTATVMTSPAGFPNRISASASWSVRLVWYGFTPGYWKNHPTAWVGYTPNQLVRSIFVVPSALLYNGKLDMNRDGMEDTLMAALSYQGGSTLSGKAQILLRAAVAALLNEAALDDYFPPYDTKAELIAAVNSTLATLNSGAYTSLAKTLDYWNNGIHMIPAP